MAPTTQYKSTGRRKSAVAQVILIPGSGKIIINGKDGTEYMQYNPRLVSTIQSPLNLLSLEEGYDVLVRSSGGGLSGQAEAIRLGIARALCKLDVTNRGPLKSEGFFKLSKEGIFIPVISSSILPKELFTIFASSGFIFAWKFLLLRCYC